MSSFPHDGHDATAGDGASPGTAPQPASGQPAGTSHGEHGQYGQYGRPAAPQYGAPPAPPQYAAVGEQQGGVDARYGQYGAPAPGGYYGPGFGHVPGLQPGIIPLRPLSLGEIYDGAFRAIRSNPAVMFGLSALVVAVSTLIELALVGTFLSDVEAFLLSGSTDVTDMVNVGSFAGVILASAVTSFATIILTGLLILSVSESVLGRTISIGDLWTRARGQVWRLVLLTLLMWAGATALVVGGIVVLVLAIAGLAVVSPDSALVAFLGSLVLLAGLALVLAWLAVRTMLAPPAIMLERVGVFASLARSWRLSKGHFWRLLGIMLLTLVLLSVLQGILTVPFSLVGAFAGPGEAAWPMVLGIVGGSIASAVAIPFVAAVLALLYVDVRMRTEALDVELARAAQER